MAERRTTYRVFISSTYIDNAARRRTVEDAVQRADMQPVGMERFTASECPTVEACEEWVRQCDIYVGIVAHRYGWIPDGHEVSITELEYDAAKQARRPRLMFQIAPGPVVTTLLDAQELLIEAHYSKENRDLLRRVNLLLERLRVLTMFKDWRDKVSHGRDMNGAVSEPRWSCARRGTGSHGRRAREWNPRAQGRGSRRAAIRVNYLPFRPHRVSVCPGPVILPGPFTPLRLESG